MMKATAEREGAEILLLVEGRISGPWVEELEQFWRAERTYEPKMKAGRREELYQGWKTAVARCRFSG
jgi:glycerol kinase